METNTLTKLYETCYDGIHYFAIGNGSQSLHNTLRRRFGDEHNTMYLKGNQLCKVFDSYGDNYGVRDEYRMYFIPSHMFHLCNAIGKLPEGYRIYDPIKHRATLRDAFSVRVYNTEDQVWGGESRDMQKCSVMTLHQGSSIIAVRKEKPFKWVRDRLPTDEDADSNGLVWVYTSLHEDHPLHIMHVSVGSIVIHAGAAWATDDEVAKLSPERPAHPPHNQ